MSSTPIDFPKDRPEAGLGSGPLQEGDSWRYNSIEYTWVLSPDGTGMWSSKGINVNPDNYIAKTDPFSGDVEGYYNQPGGFNVTNAETAGVADKVQNTLTLRYVDDQGAVTTTTYDGSQARTFTFTDTDDATQVITITGSQGIDVVGTDVRANSTIARSTSGYATTSAGSRLLSSGTQGTLTINQGGTQRGVFNGNNNVTVNLDAGGGGGTTQDLTSVLGEGNSASNSITLTNANGRVDLLPEVGTAFLARSNGQAGVEFRTNVGGARTGRIGMSTGNLILETTGGVFVSSHGNDPFEITPDSGTTPVTSGDPLHRVTRFNVRQEMDDEGINETSAFNAAINWVYANLSTPSIYFPSGNYTIASVTFPYNTSTTQISIYGDGKGEGTEIFCQGTIFIGHPVNIKGIKFTGRTNGPSLKFERNPTGTTGPQQDDMDSTVSSCDFGNGGSEGYTGAVDIDFRGRNLLVNNCKFITGGATGIAIRLSYFCNDAEVTTQDEVGWKRIMITNNNFHNFEGGAIVLGSSQNTANDVRPRLRGLVVANNTSETDGVFMRHEPGSNCRLEGAAITGNTILIYRDRTAIDLQDVYASSIVGNTFNGYAEDGRLININIDRAWASTVTGNVFNSGQGSGADGALSGGTWRGCVVSANTWFGSASGRLNINNTPDCDIQTPVGTSFEP